MRALTALAIIFSIRLTDTLLDDPTSLSSSPHPADDSDLPSEIASTDPGASEDQAFVRPNGLSPPAEEFGPVWPWMPDCLDAERNLVLCCNSAYVFGTAFGCSLWGHLKAVCERTDHLFCCNRQEWFLGRNCRFAYVPA